MAPKLTAVALAALAFAAPAAAQTPIIDLAANSARGRSVYVHPDARLLTPAEARRLEREIEQQAQGPLYIAILPPAARDEVDGTATGVVVELNRRIITTNAPAVHAVVVGNQFRAVNRDIPAGDLATAAFQAHRDEGVAAVLSDFVRRVGESRRAQAEPVATEDESGGGFPYWLLVVGGGIAACSESAPPAAGNNANASSPRSRRWRRKTWWRSRTTSPSSTSRSSDIRRRKTPTQKRSRPTRGPTMPSTAPARPATSRV